MPTYPEWRRRAEKNEWSRQAFNCAKCPREGCPAWVEYHVINPSNAQLEHIECCSFQLVPQLFAESLGMTHQAGRETSRQTETTQKAAVLIARSMQHVQAAIEENTTNVRKLLPDASDPTD